ncbi:MAG: cobalt-precorrin-5B (C(1))-methyltransferase CbiD [Oscillospiraceae bacterium]|nr:cobalt-precorrin-5B (C(1))-methyltransferase CbiD [Oscillospiraceae bacterium]
MIMTGQRLVGGKMLRCGYTTGSCAAAAAKAAAAALLTGVFPDAVEIRTPKGPLLTLDVRDPSVSDSGCRCAIQKDSGDDPDITNGILVYATVAKTEAGITIDGGEGVGRVTRPGLDQPPGAAAINSVPRQMIRDAVSGVAEGVGYAGGLSVVIDIPDGRRLAQKTFNPHLGIEGGISVLGTSGIVEPMSDEALAESIRVEIRVLAEKQKDAILITLGNYGYDFASGPMGLSMEDNVTCSNFIGTALDSAVENGFRRVLLIGHIGKLVKLGIGLFNTHSRNGDGRLETLTACALQAGADLDLLRKLASCVTTDAALDVLESAGLLDQTLSVLRGRISFYIGRRMPDSVQTEFVCFSNSESRNCVLFRSDGADALINRWR